MSTTVIVIALAIVGMLVGLIGTRLSGRRAGSYNGAAARRQRSISAYVMLACAVLLLIIAFTGGAHKYVDIAVGAAVGVVGVVILVQNRRQKSGTGESMDIEHPPTHRP